MENNHRLSNEQFAEGFKKRTKKLAIDVIRFSQALPKSDEVFILKKQLLRSATSVAANYRAACRARSGGDFYSKLSIVVEEADETLFWLELLTEAEIVSPVKTEFLMAETSAILSVVAKARKSAKP